MAWRFTKMHGAGNDFAIVDARDGDALPDAAMIAAAGDRHRGIGFDQLISIEPAHAKGCAFRYGIWNADGSTAGQCGNGARCVAAWLFRDGSLALEDEAMLESPSGAVAVVLHSPSEVSVNMGMPRFAPADIPFEAPTEAAHYPLEVNGEMVEIATVSMGNPHAVVLVDDVGDARARALAERITTHPRFPQGCNTGLAQVMARDALRLRVHERGAGWTLACGSGACAAVAALKRAGRLDAHVHVSLPGGTLAVDWPAESEALWLAGPARFVYEGYWLDDADKP